jgi:DNA-directed RNA polymerase specialized sigma24 family protein
MIDSDEMRKPTQSAKARRSRRTRGQRKATRAITSHATHSCADDDLVLVQRAKNGDRTAFDVLVRKHRDRLIGSIAGRFMQGTYMLLYRSEAHDIAQQAFVNAYSALDSYRGGSTFYTWLWRIGANTAKNFLAAMKQRPMDYLAEQYAYPVRHAESADIHEQAFRHREASDLLKEPGLLGRPYCGERYQNMVLHLYGRGINGQRFKDQRAKSLRRPELCDGTKYGHVMHVSRSPQRGWPVK